MKETHPKVFFVDDEPEIRAIIEDILGKQGYEVTSFANAQSCLVEVERTGCNLVITDFKMPGMSGIDLLTEIKRKAPWVPVIIVTGYGNIELAVYAIKIGAADFLEKPLDRTKLLNKVQEVLTRSEYYRHQAALKLTKTENMVLKLILEGWSNKEIARKMNCVVRTVEFHHSNIYRKFGVDNAVDLTKKAMAMFASANGN